MSRIPAIRGICFTELTDLGQEIAGLMTYDRKTKVDLQLIKELNDLLRCARSARSRQKQVATTMAARVLTAMGTRASHPV